MIRLELQGGLGNQLFIWAMAHHLSSHYKKHVRIIYPLSRRSRADRPCEISGLVELCNHDISISTSKNLGHLTRLVDKLNSFNQLAKVVNLGKIGIVTESHSSDANTNYVKPPRLIRGFFQNAKMVDNSASEILQELETFLASIAFPDDLKFERISSVAHIRRGDSTTIAQEFGVLPLSYYKQNLGTDRDIVICTDETTNLEEFHREFPSALVITPIESNSWQTLKVLSSAKKLVMANSTLSWWGARIAKQNSGAEIFFPSPWRPRETQAIKAIIMGDVVLTSSGFKEKN